MGEAKRKRETVQAQLRPGLPPVPPSMQHLPVDHRGFFAPWFVAWLDEAGRPVPDGQGTPDFRVIGPGKVQAAVAHQLCWICGNRLESPPVAAVLGPMCAVNRVSSEPPSHVACARYAVQVCPFLTKPRMRRNRHDLPEQTCDGPGIAVDRNPGVAALWVTNRVYYSRQTRLFTVDDPVRVEWWAEGREATRTEVLASITSGLPLLRAACNEEPVEWRADAHAQLEAQVVKAMTLLPR
jgi:hypothetical protein